jgi:hypothetical protein
MAQAGLVFDAVRKELAAQSLDIMPDAEARATGAVFGDTFLVSAAATSPASPQMKRLLTPAEMELMTQFARDMALRARQDWDEAVAIASMSSEESLARYTPSLAQLNYMGTAATVVQFKMLRTSYLPPALLADAELDAVAHAYEVEREAPRRAAALEAEAQEGGE